MLMKRAAGIAIVTALVIACSPAPPTTQQLAQEAAAAMGGADRLRAIKTLAMKGGVGTRLRLGQTVHATDTETPATLKNVVETVDLANGRAQLDYELQLGAFGQHRKETLTKKNGRAVGLEDVAGRPLAIMSPSGLFSWGTQNNPEVLLRRNIITVMSAALMSPTSDAPSDRQLDGKTYKYGTATLANGERVGLYFDPQSKLLSAYETTDTETMLGDLPAQYLLADYRDINGVKLPHTITIRKGRQPYSDVRFSSASIDDPADDSLFAIPDSANAEVDRAIQAGDYSPIAISKIGDGVYFARAYSHNSMIVEFPAWLAVVEAAYTDAQSATLVRALNEQFPGKPIRYAIVTHHHFDHTGGVRGLAAAGATILVEKGHEPLLRTIVESPHTNPPDALETARKSGKAGALEIYEGKKVLSDGKQLLELYPITGNPHVDPKVIVYAPSARALFQSDLFIPGVGAPAGPEAAHLLKSVQDLKLRVDRNVGGHGGVAPFAELVKAVAATGR
jgi:glyoxylase-like metal-dependent hydrolase (beta-lactamase superfamily II)